MTRQDADPVGEPIVVPGDGDVETIGQRPPATAVSIGLDSAGPGAVDNETAPASDDVMTGGGESAIEAPEPAVDPAPIPDTPPPPPEHASAPAPTRGAPASLPVAAPRPRTLFAARLLQALWLGGGVFLMFLAAPAAFRASATPGDAANVVGAMLTRWHYLALIIPALLILIEWRRMRPRVVVLLFIAIVAAALQGGVDLRIRAIRQQSIISISSLSPSDPLRRQFGLLHGLSSVLLLAQVICAAASIAVEPDE